MSGFLKWYEKNGTADAIAVSSRVRLARNLAGYPFPHAASGEQKKEILEKVLEACRDLDQLGLSLTYYAMEGLSDTVRLQLAEHHLVSSEFIRQSAGRGVLVSADESVSIMIGEEDHIRIQVVQAGLELEKALELAMAIDNVLEEKLTFAFDDTYGYLTACPTNIGTGMRASVMLHLFGMDQLSLVARLASTVSKMGLIIRGTYGSSTKTRGHDYLISNQVSLGIEESQAVTNLKSIVTQIIRQELSAQHECINNRAAFEDSLFRTLGQMKYARRMSYEELCENVSLLRVGICQKAIAIRPHVLSTLLLTTGPAAICGESETIPGAAERDAKRAKAVQAALADTE